MAKKRKYDITGNAVCTILGYGVASSVSSAVPASATKTTMMNNVGAGFSIGSTGVIVGSAGMVMDSLKTLQPRKKRRK
jgi:hypothetical protein